MGERRSRVEGMEIKNKKLLFCFPYRGPGGVSLLFLRLANHLKHIGFSVALIDYLDGYMSLNNKENLELIEYGGHNIVKIDDNSILILQAMTPWSIYPLMELDLNTNLFFISTIPQNFYPLLPGLRDKMSGNSFLFRFICKSILRNEYIKVKNFLKIAIEKKSMVFLDEDIVKNVIHNLDLELKAYNLLPLFGGDSIQNFYLKKNVLNKKELNIGWVGRIADFKVHILNKVITDLKKYTDENDIKIKFTIVGSGDKEKTLVSFETDKFKIERIEQINPESLSLKLLTFDLYFAMGTSALDGARLGIPTVRLDYSFKPIVEEYKYKFLFDVKGFSAGEHIGGKFYTKGMHTIADVLLKLIEEKDFLSKQTFEFYNENHSYDSSKSKFLKYLSHSNLSYKDLKFRELNQSRLFSLFKKVKP